MNKTKFSLFISFAFVIPLGYLVTRYNLFKPTTKLQIGIWGIIVFGIMIASLKILITFYLEGMKTKYSLFKQCLEGFTKLIFPLMIILVISELLKNNIDLLIEALFVIIPCEVVAIIINPLPKWCYDNNIEGFTAICDKAFSKKEDK